MSLASAAAERTLRFVSSAWRSRPESEPPVATVSKYTAGPGDAWHESVTMTFRATQAPPAGNKPDRGYEQHRRPTDDIPQSSRPPGWFVQRMLERNRHELCVPIFTVRHQSHIARTMVQWDGIREEKDRTSPGDLIVTFSQLELLNLALDEVQRKWKTLHAQDVLSNFAGARTTKHGSLQTGNGQLGLGSFMTLSQAPVLFIRHFQDLILLAKLSMEDKNTPQKAADIAGDMSDDKETRIMEMENFLLEMQNLAKADLASNGGELAEGVESDDDTNATDAEQNSKAASAAAAASDSTTSTASTKPKKKKKSRSKSKQQDAAAAMQRLREPRAVYLRLGHQFLILARADRYLNGGRDDYRAISSRSTAAEQAAAASAGGSAGSSGLTSAAPQEPSHRTLQFGRAQDRQAHQLHNDSYWTLVSCDPQRGPTYAQLRRLLRKFTQSKPFQAYVRGSNPNVTRGLLSKAQWVDPATSLADKETALLCALTRAILTSTDKEWEVARDLLHPVHKHGTADPKTKGRTIIYDDTLSIVLATLFVAETARNPMTWLTTLMLLDLIEARVHTGVDWLQLQQSEANQASPINFQHGWPTLDFFTMLHRAESDSKHKSNSESYAEGLHPMAHTHSFTQLQECKIAATSLKRGEHEVSAWVHPYVRVTSPKAAEPSHSLGADLPAMWQQQHNKNIFISCRARELGVVTAWVKSQIFDPGSYTRRQTDQTDFLFHQVAHLEDASHGKASPEAKWQQAIARMICNRLDRGGATMAYVPEA